MDKPPEIRIPLPHLSRKNLLSVVIGVCVFGLATIPLKVAPEHLSWLRWQLCIYAFGGVGIVAIFVQALLQSKEDVRRDEREDKRDEKLELIYTHFLKGEPVGVEVVSVKAQPDAHAPIVGTAELLAVRLDLSDLHIGNDWQFSADFGVFVRMWVGVTDKPRTIKGFVIEIRTLKDGKVQEPAAYAAVSERSVGDHLYRYKYATTNSYGYAIEEEEREEMPDLMPKLEDALQPDTGKDGWARFEMKGIKHSLEECHIVIYALDIRDERHEIDTTNMVVKRVEDHAYVLPKRRNW